MPLDLYADELVPESTARPNPPRTGLWAVVVASIVVIAAWFLLYGPKVNPTPGPGPEPDPSPIVASGLHVLVIEETSERDKLTPAQVAIFTSGDLIDWYKANCAKEDGATAYRCFDKDTKLDQENQVWRDMKQALTLPPPAVLMIDGKRAAQMKLPADPDAMKAALEKFKSSRK